jgi:kynureninase
VIGDFCAPDVIRFGLPPLHSSFADVLAGVVALRALLLEWPLTLPHKVR